MSLCCYHHHHPSRRQVLGVIVHRLPQSCYHVCQSYSVDVVGSGRSHICHSSCRDVDSQNTTGTESSVFLRQAGIVCGLPILLLLLLPYIHEPYPLNSLYSAFVVVTPKIPLRDLILCRALVVGFSVYPVIDDGGLVALVALSPLLPSQY